MQYVLPASFAFLSGLILWLLKRPRRSLAYAVKKLTEYLREGATVRLYSLRILNQGNRLIDATDVSVAIDGGHIASLDPTEPSLVKDLALEDRQAHFRIPLLNPGEGTEIIIFVTEPLPGADPKVVARARGVTATQRDSEGYFVSSVSLGAVTVAVTALGGFAVVQSFSSSSTISSAISSTISSLRVGLDSMNRDLSRANQSLREIQLTQDSIEKGLPKAEEELFVLFATAGIPDLYPQFLSGGEVTYWRAGYFLFTRCIVDPARCRTYATAMDKLLDLPMTPSSEGFNLYLASKVQRRLGDARKADLLLDKLKATRPLMYEHLMRNDRAFDMDRIRAGLAPRPH